MEPLRTGSIFNSRLYSMKMSTYKELKLSKLLNEKLKNAKRIPKNLKQKISRLTNDFDNLSAQEFNTVCYYIIKDIELLKCTNPDCDNAALIKMGQSKFNSTCSSKECVLLHAEATKQEKYSNKHYNNRIKAKQTSLELYNVDNPAKSDNIKQKTKITNLKLYNAVCPLSNKLIKEKSVNTVIKKYNVTNVMKNDEIKQRAHNTNLKIYGNESASSNSKIKRKIVDSTKISSTLKYGTDHHNQKHIKHSNDFNDKFILEQFVSQKNNLMIPKMMEYFNISKSYTYKWLRKINFDYTLVNKSGTSVAECELFELVKSIDQYAEQSNRTIIKPKEIDIISHVHKFAIEYNGILWHSIGNSNSEKHNNINKLNELKYYHLNKTEALEKLGYRLFHVNENTYMKNPTLCRSIIRNALGVYKEIHVHEMIALLYTTEMK